VPTKVRFVRLHTQSDLLAARDAFHALFRNGLSCDQPLRYPGTGVILWDIRIDLNEDQYRALAAAGAIESDTEAYLSYLGDYEGDQGSDGRLSPDFELSGHYRFDLKLFPPRDFGEDWHGMAEHAIYSPRGTWGIMTSLEWHGIAVGSDAFRTKLSEAQVFANSLERFLAYWKDCRDRLGAKTSWIPLLLDNVYGGQADQILVDFGEPRERWCADSVSTGQGQDMSE